MSRFLQSVLFAVVVVASTQGFAKNCSVSNAVLDGMSKAELQIRSASQGDSTEPLVSRVVKVADDGRERSQGFQRICQEGIVAEPILFVFPRPFQPGFHMNNVVEPLDIAFIDSNGVIVDILRMDTYVLGSTKRPLYRPSKPALAALEAEVGFYAKHGVKVGDVVTWGAWKEAAKN